MLLAVPCRACCIVLRWPRAESHSLSSRMVHDAFHGGQAKYEALFMEVSAFERGTVAAAVQVAIMQQLMRMADDDSESKRDTCAVS